MDAYSGHATCALLREVPVSFCLLFVLFYEHLCGLTKPELVCESVTTVDSWCVQEFVCCKVDRAGE